LSTLPTDDYVFYADQRKMNGNLNKRMLLICVPLVLFMFALCGILTHGLDTLSPHPSAHSGHAPLFVRTSSPIVVVLGGLPWFLTAEILILWLISGRAQRKQVKPLVTLSPQGMSIDTTAQHLGLLTWDEIGEVRTYNLIYRYVGIVPRDTQALCRRLGTRRSWVLWMNAACIPLYKLFGRFVAPINIPQVYLPVTADELAATIHRYQAAYARTPNWEALPPSENVWPPPPRLDANPNEQ
jgi:hypothetical protein